MEFWGAQYEQLDDVAHDLMLDTHWVRGAQALHRWLQCSTFPQYTSSSQAAGAVDVDADASQQLAA